MATKNKAQIRLNVTKLIMVSLVVLSLVVMPSGVTFAQGKKPITKVGLSEALKENGLSPKELARYIQQRGVNFQLSAQDEADFRSIGARPEVIDAARANYRPPTTLPSTDSTKPEPPPPSSPPTAPLTSSGTAPNSAIKVPPGPPLSKNEVITMLQSGVAVDRVERFVEVRGVNFNITQDIAREITGAGGNRSLLGAISEKSLASIPSPTPGPPNANTASIPSGTEPDYDDLTDQAQTALSSTQYVQAVRLLQQAIRLDPSQSRAYQMLGKTLLYRNRDFAGAERAMRAAIEHGGEAVFEVFHDHGNGLFQQYCKGSFFVSKGGVTFRADDGAHTFEVYDSVIKETKVNRFVGNQVGGFHLKVIVSNGKSVNFNFAPATVRREESDLIIALVTGYRDDGPVVSATADSATPTVDQILDKYVESVGGSAAIERVTSRMMIGTFEISGRQVTGTIEYYTKAPRMSLATFKLQGTDISKQGFDGTNGWSKHPKKEAQQLTGAQLKQAMRESDPNFGYKIKDYYSTLVFKGVTNVDKRRAYLIEAKSDAAATENLYFDIETGLFIRRDYEQFNSQGTWLIKETFEDYRDVDGLKFPHVFRQVFPYGTQVITLSEVRHNVVISDDKFARPIGK